MLTWDQIANSIQRERNCPLLRSYWHFSNCRYLKSAQTCSHPAVMPTCVVPRLPLRKEILNQAAVSLCLFIRDVCDRGLVGWLDYRLEGATCA
jgi:hypothetical protein